MSELEEPKKRNDETRALSAAVPAQMSWMSSASFVVLFLFHLCSIFFPLGM